MTTHRPTLLALSSLCAAVLVPLLLTGAPAQAPAPSAAEVLRLVRYSQSANEQDFDGAIRDRRIGRVDIPLKLTLSEKEVRFVFFEDDKSRNDPDQILILTLLQNRYKLEEISGGKKAELPAGRYAERVRDTDITFEDLAMRFLYWPNPKHVSVEKAKGGDAWKIRCTNPVADGAYAVVDVWVSQESGALVRMNGYDKAGKHVKSFEVDKVQRHEGAWVLRKMIVRSHKDGKITGNTYLSVEPPK